MHICLIHQDIASQYKFQQYILVFAHQGMFLPHIPCIYPHCQESAYRRMYLLYTDSKFHLDMSKGIPHITHLPLK